MFTAAGLLGVRELHNRALGSSSQLAVSAVCGLIRYLDLMASKETHGLWTLDWVDAAQFMRLDSGAMRALSVDPQVSSKQAAASSLLTPPSHTHLSLLPIRPPAARFRQEREPQRPILGVQDESRRARDAPVATPAAAKPRRFRGAL